MLQPHLRRTPKPALHGVGAFVTAWLLGACASPGVETGAQPAGTVLTEANIGSIASTANSGEIQAANLALSKTSNPAVRRFAQQMLTDHTDANRRLEAVLSELGTSPAPTDITRQLTSISAQSMEALQGRTGTDFDRAYIENQVAQHRWLLETIDTALIPSARSGEMERYLQWLRPTVASHLSQAQQVQQSLGQD